MSNKSIGKLFLCFLLLFLGIWTGSFFPYVFIVFLIDSFKKDSYYNQLCNFVKIKVHKWYSIVEWITALLLAFLILVFFQNNFIGIYTFHTSSMLETLQVGDVLVVNKFALGGRKFPNNVNWYHRGSSIRKLSYEDVVIFNFPEGDTLLTNRPTESYHYLKRQYAEKDFDLDEWGEIMRYEVDERPRFVKRIYGLPGDSISIKDGQFYANTKHVVYPKFSLNSYLIDENQKDDMLKFGLRPHNEYMTKEGLFWELMDSEIEHLKELNILPKPNCLPRNFPDPLVFPYNIHLLWNMDNMGPIYIPKKGDVVELDKFNLQLYKRIIESFEENTLRAVGDSIFVNDALVTEYTFKMNYYWVMGDNRPHSFDSRFWGFVPENHIIGIVDRVMFSDN